MKSLRSLTIALIVLGTTSCIQIQGQHWKTVEGNRKVVTKERKTDSFTGVKVSSGIDVYLKQGDNEAVSVFIANIISAMQKEKGSMSL